MPRTPHPAAGLPPGIRHLLLASVEPDGVLRTRRTSGWPRRGLLCPDPRSLSPLPWAPDTAWLACTRRHPRCPRAALQRQMERARGRDLLMQTGVECEFHLLSLAGACADTRDTSARPCYEQAALARRFDFVRELLETVEGLGWSPYQADHEDANGQFELNWGYGDALCTADRHLYFRYLAATAAARRGMYADFMPLPVPGQTGNGCHVHVSLWDAAGRRNRFLDRGDPLGLSAGAYHFIGGLLRHASALCALLAPVPDSYRRLHAPLHAHGRTWTMNVLTYAGGSRVPAIRVPAPGRIELRLADGAANPYLLQAGLLAAGLDGMQRRLDPHACRAPRLPATPGEASRALAASRVLRAALGAPLTETCVATLSGGADRGADRCPPPS